MSEEAMVRDLFDRWERVWNEGRYDLISDCVQPNYIRHDETGDRTVTREAYAAEIAMDATGVAEHAGRAAPRPRPRRRSSPMRALSRSRHSRPGDAGPRAVTAQACSGTIGLSACGRST